MSVLICSAHCLLNLRADFSSATSVLTIAARLLTPGNPSSWGIVTRSLPAWSMTDAGARLSPRHCGVDLQGGNNNTYCHDSPLNWLDWKAATAPGNGFARFFRNLIALRCAAPRCPGPPAADRHEM